MAHDILSSYGFELKLSTYIHLIRIAFTKLAMLTMFFDKLLIIPKKNESKKWLNNRNTVLNEACMKYIIISKNFFPIFLITINFKEKVAIVGGN